jgi:hypothetical protein
MHLHFLSSVSSTTATELVLCIQGRVDGVIGGHSLVRLFLDEGVVLARRVKYLSHVSHVDTLLKELLVLVGTCGCCLVALHIHVDGRLIVAHGWGTDVVQCAHCKLAICWYLVV